MIEVVHYLESRYTTTTTTTTTTTHQPNHPTEMLEKGAYDYINHVAIKNAHILPTEVLITRLGQLTDRHAVSVW